jgi:hypothetical protein
MRPLRPSADEASRPTLAAATVIHLITASQGLKDHHMEGRLIVVYIAFALLAIIGVAGAVVLARVRRDHRRLHR